VVTATEPGTGSGFDTGIRPPIKGQ